MKINSEREYEEALRKVEYLMDTVSEDAPDEDPKVKEMLELADAIEKYEEFLMKEN